MIKLNYPPAVECQPSVATIGFFDGVHAGHRSLIRQVMQCGRERDLSSLLVTFDRHPRGVLQPSSRPSLLTTLDEKCALLSATGADCLLVLPFTRELSELSAREFMTDVLREQLNVRMLVVGYDHRFGHDRVSSYEDYVAMGHESGIEVVRAEALSEGGATVSSSFVRSLIKTGDVAAAARCLTRPYSLTGKVVRGFRVGRKLGYPTANIRVAETDKMIPARGAYAVRLRVDGSDDVMNGMLNIGIRPTLDNGAEATIEANIFDFTGDLYGHDLRVDFIGRLREECRFDGLQALQAQLVQDEAKARVLLGDFA
ncbi:MAG: bifunctional riboflavin kinase/FAD synthetase [Clostridium sp.]|nr:bifunctional riboflavin kinase/FAD synthetase [Clostridium sp.]